MGGERYHADNIHDSVCFGVRKRVHPGRCRVRGGDAYHAVRLGIFRGTEQAGMPHSICDIGPGCLVHMPSALVRAADADRHGTVFVL